MKIKDTAKKLFVSLYPDYADWFDIHWNAVSQIETFNCDLIIEEGKFVNFLGISGQASEIVIEQAKVTLAINYTLKVAEVEKTSKDILESTFAKVSERLQIDKPIRDKCLLFFKQLAESAFAVCPILELGIEKSGFYVRLDGKNLIRKVKGKEKEIEERCFVDLCLLATVKQKRIKEGYLHMMDALGWRGKSQEFSELRNFFRANEIMPEKIFQKLKTNEIRLRIDANVDKSICNFESTHIGSVRKKLGDFEQMGTQTNPNWSMKAIKRWKDTGNSFVNSTETMKKCCKLLGYKFNYKGFRKEYEYKQIRRIIETFLSRYPKLIKILDPQHQ